MFLDNVPLLALESDWPSGAKSTDTGWQLGGDRTALQRVPIPAFSNSRSTNDGVLIARWAAGDRSANFHHNVCFPELLLIPIAVGWLLGQQTQSSARRAFIK